MTYYLDPGYPPGTESSKRVKGTRMCSRCERETGCYGIVELGAWFPDEGVCIHCEDDAVKAKELLNERE